MKNKLFHKSFTNSLLTKVAITLVLSIGLLTFILEATLWLRDKKYIGQENAYFQHDDPFLRFAEVVIVIISLIIGGILYIKRRKR